MDLDLEGAEVDADVAVLIIIHESNKIIIKAGWNVLKVRGKWTKQAKKNMENIVYLKRITREQYLPISFGMALKESSYPNTSFRLHPVTSFLLL